MKAIVALFALFAVAQAGVLLQSAVPVVHSVPVAVVPAAHSSQYSYRAPAAKVIATPVVAHAPVAYHAPVVAHAAPVAVAHSVPVVSSGSILVH